MKKQITPQPKTVKVEDPIETELEALKAICVHISSVQEDSQRRIIIYLKSKYGKVWPYEG